MITDLYLPLLLKFCNQTGKDFNHSQSVPVFTPALPVIITNLKKIHFYSRQYPYTNRDKHFRPTLPTRQNASNLQ